jgi:hexokinase
VYRQEAYFEQLEPGTQCKPKSLFSAELPVSHGLTNMALEAEAQRMVAQFEYPAEEVNRGVKEFIREMQEGLETEGAMLSQIPTYVTSVPNGTEKVGWTSRSRDSTDML